MTTVQASKKTKKIVFSNLQDRIDRQKSKSRLGQLVSTADIKRFSSKGDSTNFSYSFYIITEVIYDTIPSYRINFSPERYNEILLRSTKISLDQNQLLKKPNLIQKYNK